MSNTAIHLDGVTCDLGRVRALDKLSLEVPSGIVFGLLGPNGAGKTTTIRILLGLLDPSEGSATVLGFDTRTRSGDIRRRTGALLEFPGLYERLTAEDNLSFCARAWGLSTLERNERIRTLLTGIDLWERRKELVGTWSRGMKQKLAVARALLPRPELVFLDEPTAGLDPLAAASLREDLAALVAREGVTVFLTTHNLAEAEKLCARVGVIRQGHLLAIGHPDEIRAQRAGVQVEVVGAGFGEEVLAVLRETPGIDTAEVRNGRLHIGLSTPETSFAPIARKLVQAGADIEEIRRGRASLEEAFVTLVEENGT